MMRSSYALLAVLLASPAAAQEATPSPEPSGSVEAAAPAPAPSPAPVDDRPALELSLGEAVERTLKNNVDIAVEKFRPETSEEQVNELRGAYDPLLTSTLSESSRQSPATNAFAGASNVDNDTRVYNFGASQFLRTGGSFRVAFDNSRGKTNSVFSTFNPSYNSSVNLALTQPLLRNFAVDSTRYQLKVAKKNREISDVTFRQTVVNTVSGVKQAYYDLLYAIDNLNAQRKSLSLAQRLLEENRIRVRVGTMAPLDVVAAEAEQASREEAVILAEAAVREAEDVLKRAIFPANDPQMWTLRIVPTDRPTAEPFAVDTEGAIKKAVEARTDLSSARLSLQNAEYGVDYARNQTRPGLDLIANYGTTGIGGTQVLDPITREPLASPITGGYGNALGDVFGRDFPAWSVGVNFSYPLFNRAAQATKARARISRDQAEANLRRLELQVAAEVRSAARAVETNFKRVASTRAARVLAERRLDAETKKFAAGMSTNFLVTQSQRDLALAEVAELRAIADYRKSVVSFERVQEAGGGSSSGSSLVVSTSSRGTTTTSSSGF